MSSESKIIIGSRASTLALIQSNIIKTQLQKLFPGLEVGIKEIQTKGDKNLDTALSKIGDKGLFVKELEDELLAGTIDLAVHSMKDMQTSLPKGLEIAATTKREDCRDVVCFSEANINAGKKSLSEIKRAGTSSLRRIAQLRRKYPHIEFVPIRGNLETRFRKLNDPKENLDAIILAYAGIKRLNKNIFLNAITEYLDPQEILPAVGQGALAIEIASKNQEIKDLVSKLNSYDDEMIVKGERAFLRSLEGGCQVPIGIYSKIEKPKITYQGIVLSLDGSKFVMENIEGDLTNSEELGKQLAEKLIAKGAKTILSEIFR